MGRLTNKYLLKGLSKPRSATLEHIGDDFISFNASVEMDKERFDALFTYCQNNWKDKKYAMVEHDGLDDIGYPRNPKVIEIVEA